MLATRLTIAGSVIGLAAGSLAYVIETRRVEQAAFKSALRSAANFRSQDMERLVAIRSLDRHKDVDHFLKSTRFVGIRILDLSGQVMQEAWENVPRTLASAIATHRHPLPVPGTHHHNWLAAGGEDFIQVVLPLAADSGPVYGYFEGVYRLDPELRAEQKERVRDSAATALIAALLASLFAYPLMLRLTKRTLDLSQSLLDSNIELMQTLGCAIAKRDSDTDAHNYRVTLYSVRLAEAMGRSDGDIAKLISGAFLHDVGKIGIPDHILRKPGSLTPEEFEVMKTHVQVGQDIAANTHWLAAASEVILNHHEKYDGAGYPVGLAGENIPFNARLFAVVDVFDALTSARPYKAPMPVEQALFVLQEKSGKHFDPAIVAAFATIAPDLYMRIGSMDPSVLRDMLRDILQVYF